MSSLTRLPYHLDPRESSLPILVVFVGGVLMHAVDQFLHLRAGPIPILVTAPTVASLAFLYSRPNTSLRRVGLLLLWGFIGTGLAVIAVALHAISYQLPRAMTELEMVLYDLGMFLWFVFSLAGAYRAAARVTERNGYLLAVILVGPIVQVGWALVVVLAVMVSGFG